MMDFIKRLFKLFSTDEENDDGMKYLIVGLGNPGSEYAQTRHNIGFEVLDHWAEDRDLQWKSVSHGWMAETKHKGRQILLLKPNTYMNRSGKAVRYWLQKQKIPVDRLLVVVDDIHLDVGVRRLRSKGSNGGHNGLKDIESTLSSQSYARLRLGVGNDFHPGRQVEYVLGRWPQDQLDQVSQMKKTAVKCIKDFCSLEFKYALNNCNGR